MNDYLGFAMQLADSARKIALRYYKTNVATETKSDESPVTIADKEINRLVVDRVRQHYPEHGILGEEQSWHEDRTLLWVCDPLDGTIAYSMGDPTFMFSLALVDDGVPIVAVAADVAGSGIFSAVKGQGAYLDNKPLRVSGRSLPESWLALPTHLPWLYKYEALYRALAERAYQTNIIHGGVFKGMLVAQGLADAVIWPESVDPWDMAAVQLIVTEAGGRFTDLEGKNHRLDRELTGGLVVSNAVIHDSILDIARTALR